MRESLLDHIEAIHKRQIDMLAFARHVTEEAFAPGDMGRNLFGRHGEHPLLPEFSGQDDLRQLVHLLDGAARLWGFDSGRIGLAGVCGAVPGGAGEDWGGEPVAGS